MLGGVGLVPAAPLLVAGVSPRVPDGVGDVAAAADAVVRDLAGADLTVLLASANSSGVATAARADLGGLGRSDLSADPPVPAGLATRVAHATGLGLLDGALPLELAVLCLRLPRGAQVLPVVVPADTEGSVLRDVGQRLAEGLAAAGRDAAVLAVGEGAAGLSDGAPLHAVAGARAWQDAYVAALDDSDLTTLCSLGPAEAVRMGSRGWAAAVAALGAAAAAGQRLRVTAHAAPRGVGYVAGSTAGFRVGDG